MAGVVTNKFRLHNANQFYEMFSETGLDYMYVFMARPQPWPDESNPPQPADTVRLTNYDVWDNMIALKRATASDITHAIRRYDWTSGTIYDEYDDNKGTMWANNFQVFTEDYRIYKCMFNANGAVSTVKPTGTANSILTTGDGYQWKFMYEVTAAKALKFLTTNWLSCQTLSSDDATTQWDVQQAAVNGAIDTYEITSAGSGYAHHSGTAQAGAATTITLAATANSTGGAFVNSQVYISGGLGIGQLRTITDYNGGTKLATVDSAWGTNPDGTSTYIVSPKVVIENGGTGSGWQAYTTMTGSAHLGGLNTLVITNPGSNYAQGNVVVMANTGTGAAVAARLSPYEGHGSNAVEELAAHNIMLNVKYEGTESNTFTVDNDFRVLGIIANPRYRDNTFANATVYDQSGRLAVNVPSGVFTKDETLSGGTSGATAVVIDFTGNNQIRVANTTGAFVAGELVTGATSAVTANVTSILNANGDLIKHTGEVLYIENRSPITRATDQVEDLKIIVRFGWMMGIVAPIAYNLLGSINNLMI